jgi:outer membrane protein
MFRTIQFCLLISLLAGVSTLSAQDQPKYGHMNLGNLLESLPETKSANDDLKKFTDKLSMKDDSIQKAFQVEVKKYQEDYQSGTLPPVQAQKKEADLQEKQKAIQAFEQDAQQQVTAERDRLLKPILEKIDKAVKEVARQNHYLLIFDTSTGVTLFADTTVDVAPLVKKQLGIQ